MSREPPLRPLAGPFLWLHRRLLPPGTVAGWTPYLWLAWIGFFFVSWGFERTGTRVATVAAVALFVPLYFRYWWAQGTERAWLIGIIAGLGLALIPFNAAGGGLLVYAGAFAGFCLRPRYALVVLAALVAAESLDYMLQGLPTLQWIWAPVLTVMIGLGNVWSAERHRQHCALRESQDEVKRLAATAERERIGRDLHDLLGHTLTLITVKAELAARLAERDLAGAGREIREVERISRDALQQVREAVGGFRARGLETELANAREALNSARVELDEKLEPPPLSPAQDSLLAMVVREAVTNVIRHADARHCDIELDSDGGQLRLVVRDDGRGGAVREGNGLRGMRERLRQVAGRLDIRSGRDGTCLSILMPLQPRGPGDDAAALEGEAA